LAQAFAENIMMRGLTILAVAAAALSSSAIAAPNEAAGKQVFKRWCSACHAPGDRTPGTAALAAKYGGEKPAELEMRQDLDPEIVRYFVRNGVSVMPIFRKTEITDAELDDLGAYLSHSSSKAGKQKKKRTSR
jgi:mono/diheme cytochrome c family protein